MSLSSTHSPGPIAVLCPMQIEARAVAAALQLTNLHSSVQLVQTGIGKDAIIGAARRIALEWNRLGHSRALFILAGVCGGLIHTHPVPTIRAVIDEHGSRWPMFDQWCPAAAPPTHSPADPSHDGVILIGVDRIISTPHEKAELARQSGAAIVDMESHAFITACRRLAQDFIPELHWSIVRGVSDTPDEMLPAQILNWITPQGNTRTTRAVLDMLRQPRLIPSIRSALRRSGSVLPLVGERAATLSSSWLTHSRSTPAHSTRSGY